MKITTGKTAINESNILLERFLTYRIVFKEYFKTMDLIERGEALKYETYTRLADNFLVNVKNYSRLCVSYIEKYRLQNSPLEKKLNVYFASLISGLKCLDLEHNTLNRQKMHAAQKKIMESEKDFISTMGLRFN